MIAKLYINNNDSNAKPVKWYTEGNQYYSFVITSVGVVGNEGPQGTQGDQGPKGDQGASGSSDWTKSGNNIYNNNTGKVSIGANLDKAQLSIRGIQNDLNGGIAITTAGGTDWRMFASDTNAIQNGNGVSAGFHITGNSSIDSAFWIGGWSACVSNSFQSPTSSVLATPMAIRGVTGQTGDFMQIRSNRIVSTGDIMTVKSTGLLTLPTVTNTLIDADATNKAVITKEYLTSYTTSQIAGKMNNPSLTANFIPKALTSTTIGNSRLLDTGTTTSTLGIGVINTPLKDITLGYQADRVIGIEDSESITVGRNLTVEAGRAINFIISPLLVDSLLSSNAATNLFSDYLGNIYISSLAGGLYKQTGGVGVFTLVTNSTSKGGVTGGCVAPNGDIYICSLSAGGGVGDIYKQAGGAGSFVALGVGNLFWRSMCATPNGDIYASVGGNTSVWGGATGDIYKQTSGTTGFVAMGFPSRNYSICSSPNGDVFAAVNGGSIYKISSGTTVLTDLVQTVRSYQAITTNGTDVFTVVNNGDIWKQTNNTGAFQAIGQISRAYNAILITNSSILYATGYAINIYTVNLNSLGTPDLQGGTLKLNSGTGKGTGASDIEMYTGQVLATGTTMQTATLRAKIDNTGLMTLPSVTNALIEADATGKAVVTKEYLSIQTQTITLNPVGTTPNANGATLLEGVLNLQPANAIHGGVVSITNQSFSGVKTFTNEIIVDGVNISRGVSLATTNIAIGLGALDNTTGNSNTVVGYGAASPTGTISASSFTTAVGHEALKDATGNNNTAVGNLAGSLLTTGFRNTFIGASAGGTGQLISAQNSTAIGYEATTTKNNQVVLGNTSVLETVLQGLVIARSTTNELIDADTTGKAVATKEYVNNRLVVETAGPYTLVNADSGGIVIFTASTSLTIPTGLADGFECTFVTLSGVTLTVIPNSNILNNATGTTMSGGLSFTLKRMIALNTFIATGNL
jgi:hypothetical protein